MSRTPTVSLIIPAFDEARTVGNVVRVAVESGLFKEVILVDDGSHDSTGQTFHETFARLADEAAPATVLPALRLVTHARNLGKALAMRDGLQLATGEVVMFIDADLVGLKAEHLRNMIAPLADESEYRASLGVFASGRLATTLAQKIAPFISGQRACFRSDLADFSAWERVGFGVETALNRYLRERNIKVRVVELEALTHVMKEEKRGVLRGFLARMKMYWEIFCTWLRSRFSSRPRGSK